MVERNGLQLETRRLSSLTPPFLSKSQSLCKIQNQKREEKSQGSHHQDSRSRTQVFPPPSQKPCHECSSLRMTKGGVPVSSTKTLLTQLKVTALVSDAISIGQKIYNSRSGASPLSLHHASQKVNLSDTLCKIQNQKREEKGQGSHHQDSNPDLPTSRSKALPLVQFPPPLSS